MKSLRKNAVTKRMRFKHDVLEIECLVPKKSYSEIAEIDRFVSELFGFNPTEEDFVVNYDIKYRLGAGADND